MENLIKQKYGIEVKKIKRFDIGTSKVYFIEAHDGEYIFKNILENSMNSPYNEPFIIEALISHGIPTAKLIKTLDKDYVWKDKSGNTYHLQEFIHGETFAYNKAPDWLMNSMPNILGKIHKALETIPALPIGIGENFFKYMTPENAESTYRNTIEIAKRNNDDKIVVDLLKRIEILKCFKGISFELNRFTLKNTHGDYSINQIICGDNKINAVIDWTSSCVHPICWEIIRSFTYADPKCQEGEM